MQTVDAQRSFEASNNRTNDQPPTNLQAEGHALLMQSQSGSANMANIARQSADLVKAGILPEHCCPNTSYKFDPHDMQSFAQGHKGPEQTDTKDGPKAVPVVDASTGASGGGDSVSGGGGGGARVAGPLAHGESSHGEGSGGGNGSHRGDKTNKMDCGSDNTTLSHHNNNAGNKLPFEIPQPHQYK